MNGCYGNHVRYPPNQRQLFAGITKILRRQRQRNRLVFRTTANKSQSTDEEEVLLLLALEAEVLTWNETKRLVSVFTNDIRKFDTNYREAISNTDMPLHCIIQRNFHRA
ncbi:uncharacterized protein LOC132708288 [Cylas formicarius]|uniref:uncharacterized protein LOC132708288 n=1 Tax=Cylas formicarius TaxID=197179 RepID=UPI002958BA95|nr:uncharacterized protein LOC132708288 [Cylas formicarius]